VGDSAWTYHRERLRLLRSDMLLGTNKRLTLARWLRRTANRTSETDPLRRRREVLLCDRVAVVRADLLALADLLERTEDPDPGSVTALRALLRNGCDSPLYNADVHMSELRAALYYLRVGLGDATVVAGPSLPREAHERAMSQGGAIDLPDTVP